MLGLILLYENISYREEIWHFFKTCLGMLAVTNGVKRLSIYRHYVTVH